MKSQEDREEQSVVIGMALGAFAAVMVVALLVVWLAGVPLSRGLTICATAVALIAAAVTAKRAG